MVATSRDTSTTNLSTGTDAPKGRGCGCWIALLAVLLLGGLVNGLVVGMFLTRQEVPTEIEMTMADVAVRTIMIEPQYTDWRMPQPRDLAAGKQLFEVECAMCHGKNGKAQVDLGKTMFPPAADLTSERTRTKTDGQLYWILWHGINYTGMPAWGVENGGANDQKEIWDMVAYMRQLQGQGAK